MGPRFSGCVPVVWAGGAVNRCQRCKRILTAPPIQHGGLSLGPVCAVRLGYVPPIRESAGKAAKRPRVRASRVADEATPDMFAYPWMAA